MFKHALFLFALAIGIMASAATTLVDSDFTKCGKSAVNDCREKKSGLFRGVLPLQWSENFASWSKSYAETKLVKEGSEEYLRFHVTKVAGGAPQFYRTLPELQVGKTYRITARVRNQSDNEADLNFRMLPNPYKTLASVKIGVSPLWQTVTRTVTLKEKSPVPVALFLMLGGEGTFDFKQVKVEELSKEDLENKELLQTIFFEKTVDRSSKKIGTFTGVLPAPWQQDYTHWNKAEVTAKVVNLGPEHFLQIKVLKGAPQFLAPLQGIQPDRNYRLTAYLRNRTGAPVTVKLRILTEPYSMLSSGEWKPADSWSTQTIYFKTPDKKIDLPVALMINIEETGDLDLASLKLEECDNIGGLIQRPEMSTKNFFRTTRFPLGLQSGWCFLRGKTYGTIESDPSIKGPSGESALKLQSLPGKELGFCSEPFNVADPNIKNAVSFSYRGTGAYRAEIYTKGSCVGSIRLAPSADWKRVALPFKSPNDSWAFSLRVVGTGSLYMDSFRAGPANETAYVTTGECEISMALPKSETSAARIQFADEKPLLNYTVSGNTANTVLKGKVVNLYGESKDLASVTIGKTNRSGSLSYLLFPQKPYGQFRVELQAFRNGKAVSPVAEFVVTRLARPIYWGKDAPSSPFGVHVMAFDDSLKGMKAAGINWARLHDSGMEYIGWYYLEPVKGKWEFRDEDLKSYRKNHIRIFGQFGTAPKWASYLSKVDTGRNYISYHDRYFQPLDLKDFENYVTTVTKRYKGIIDDWFVWNEPWVIAWWGVDFNKNSRVNNGYITSKEPQADFAKLSKCAYLAAKKANPDAKISGFNTTDARGGERWTEGVYNAGGLKFCDMVDFHFYTARSTGYPGDACETAVADSLGYIKAKNGKIGKPVIMSEGQGASLGSVSGDDSMRYAGMYKHTLPWSNTENYDSIADRNVRYTVSLLSQGVNRIFLYSAHCYMDFSQAPKFLVMFNADGSPHPMLAAYSAMALRLEDMKFAEVRKPGKNTWVYLFSNGKKSQAVISGKYFARGSRILCSDKQAKAADLYGNPLTFPITDQGTVIYVEAPGSVQKLANSFTIKD